MKRLLYLFLLLYSLFASCNPAPAADTYPAEDLPFPDTEESIRITTDEEEINIAADTLKNLGFTEITDEMIASVHETYNEAYPREWTPSSSQVYAFDMEILDVANMYSDFFKGITAINNNEFEITDIEEDMGSGSEDLGIGIRNVTFRYNGTSYQFHAKAMYDWFDGSIIGYMNKVFKKENNPNRLYYMTDGYQELIVFYCSDEWAADFTAATGFTLDKS